MKTSFTLQQIVNHEEDNDEDYDQYVTPLQDIPLELIEIMGPKERKKLRETYPNLP